MAISTKETLLGLPAELRARIHECVFSMTRLTFGDVEMNVDTTDLHCIPRITRPQSNSLALLYTCRQIRSECCSLWMSRVLFNFDSPKALLSTVLPRGEDFTARIRCLRVTTLSLYLKYPEVTSPWTYGLHWYLKLLPGLKLDTLYVLAGTYIDESYRITEERIIRDHQDSKEHLHTLIDDLIKYGSGW